MVTHYTQLYIIKVVITGWLLSLHKIRKFHPISRSPKNLLKISSQENSLKFPNYKHCILAYGRNYMSNKKIKNVMKNLSYTIRLSCVRFASHCSRGFDKPSSFFTANGSLLNWPHFTEKFLSPHSTRIQNLKEIQTPTICKRQQLVKQSTL